MKKIILVLLCFFMITACGKETPKMAVEKYLKKYNNLDSEVLLDLEREIEKENLTLNQKEAYRSILKKQYKDLEYEILEEEYDEDVSYVTVKITVYDLYKPQKEALLYLENNPNIFNDENGVYDNDKYRDYVLDKMNDSIIRNDYNVIFTVTKENDKYIVVQPTENDLKKIHGVYNYELE